jgi:hypothetical protein
MTRAALLAVATAAIVGCADRPPAAKPDVPLAPPDEPKPLPAPTPRWRPVKTTDADLRDALPSVPAPMRQGLSDEQLGRDLDLDVWAFEYTGGPVRVWLEYEEANQKTVPPRDPAAGEWACDAPSGRVVLSVGRGVSARMKKIFERLGRDAPADGAVAKLLYRGEGKSGTFGGESHPGAPLWFGWSDGYGSATVAPTLVRVAGEEPQALLEVKRTGSKDRAATLRLMGRFAGP